MVHYALHSGRNKEILDDIKRQPITVGGLLGAVFAFANKVKKQTQKDEYVGIMMANAKTTLELFFALSATQRIPAMINYTDTTENILACIENVGIKTVYLFIAVSEGLAPQGGQRGKIAA